MVSLLENEWANPRKHFLTKGIGVYSLMSLAADIFQESNVQKEQYDISYFSGVLSDFIFQIVKKTWIYITKNWPNWSRSQYICTACRNLLTLALSQIR